MNGQRQTPVIVPVTPPAPTYTVRAWGEARLFVSYEAAMRYVRGVLQAREISEQMLKGAP